MKTAVLIDYIDAWHRAGEAFRIPREDAHFDAVRAAETLVRRSRFDGLDLTSIRIHHGVTPRDVDPPLFVRDVTRGRHWKDADPRVEVLARSYAPPRHDPEGWSIDKGMATAVALDASLLLVRRDVDHVIVLTHREQLLAAAQFIRGRRHPDAPGLEWGAWQAPWFRYTVPRCDGVGHISLYQADFDACRATHHS